MYKNRPPGGTGKATFAFEEEQNQNLGQRYVKQNSYYL